jgi:hypothetical protein
VVLRQAGGDRCPKESCKRLTHLRPTRWEVAVVLGIEEEGHVPADVNIYEVE